MNYKKVINYITLLTFIVMSMSLAFHSAMSHGEQLTKHQGIVSHQDHQGCHHSDQSLDKKSEKDQSNNSCCKQNCDCSISSCGSLSKIFMNSTFNSNLSNLTSIGYELTNITAQSFVPDQLRRPPKA